MKSHWLSFIGLLVVWGVTPHWAMAAVDPTSLKSFSSIPPQARIVFTRLATKDGINGKDIEFLSVTPGINSALLELSVRVAETQNWNQLHYVWGLLSERTDFTESELAVVRERLNKALNVYNGPEGSTMKQFGLTLLGRYPTAENEALLMRYLDDSNGGDKMPDSTDYAAESLGKIGTEKSIGALQAYIDKRRPLPGNKSRYYDTAVQALKEVQKRTLSSLPSKSQMDAATSTSTLSVKEQVPITSMPAERREPKWWIACIVMAVMIILSFWWLLKKQR